MSEPDPSASPAPQPRSAQLPSELSSRELRRAITAQRRTYQDLRQQSGSGLRVWWNGRILDGLVAEQERRRSRRSRSDGAPPRPEGSPEQSPDGEH